MGLDLSGVHVYERVKGTTNQARLVRVNPYVRLMGEDFAAPIYVQGGRFYSEGGAEVENFPPSFQVELAKLSPAARAEAGLREAPPTVIDDTAKPDAMWTCPDVATCGQKMPISTRKKGIHVARFHRRRTETAGSV